MNAQMISPASTNPAAQISSLSLDSLKQRLRRLNLYGLLAHAAELIGEPWVARVLEIEGQRATVLQPQAPYGQCAPRQI